MAWPSEAGSILTVVSAAKARGRGRTILVDPSAWRTRRYGAIRGLHRIFNAAEYRFYRSNAGPPEITDTPYATAASLPDTPADTFADGTWWISVSYFNGVLDSGFFPIGPAGQTYLKLEIDSGVVLTTPPAGPSTWDLSARAAGMVRLSAVCFDPAELRTRQWAFAVVADDPAPGDPPADTPDDPDGLVDFASTGFMLGRDLGPFAHGETAKVRLQVRRNDGTAETPVWRYSADSVVKSIVIDTAAPGAPESAASWGE